MKKPKWSIIIPALNEERYLPRLLDSIRNQDFKDYEIILVDSDSDDDTVKIAKGYGCRVINGKRGHPSVNRNIGSRNAKGENLIFLDADTSLPNGFLKANTEDFEKRNLDVAGCYGTPNPYTTTYRVIKMIANAYLFVMKDIWPCVEGCCIFSRKKTHERIKFDETLKLGEDFDYVQRIVRAGGRFGFLRKNAIISMRRFEKEGVVRMCVKYVGWAFEIFATGVRRDVDYEFGKF